MDSIFAGGGVAAGAGGVWPKAIGASSEATSTAASVRRMAAIVLPYTVPPCYQIMVSDTIFQTWTIAGSAARD
jgi:hypothetical protein